MKNRVFGNVGFLFVLCCLLTGLLSCSEKSTAGGTIDENSVAEFSADEKSIMENQLDSTKRLVEGAPADLGDYEVDSSNFWFEINFTGEREKYLEYERENPYADCYISIYRSEYGVWNIEWLANNEGSFVRTFFLTASDSGVTYHQKLDFNLGFEERCEKELSDFTEACERSGGTLYRHFANCEVGGLRLTCSTFKGHLSESANDVLDRVAEGMKEQCVDKRQSEN